MEKLETPYYTLSAAQLADWLETQPDKWWYVDHDPLLSGKVDFPCPTDELAPAIRKVGRDLHLLDFRPGAAAHGEALAERNLEVLKDPRENALILSWANSDWEWLLGEDEPLLP